MSSSKTASAGAALTPEHEWASEVAARLRLVLSSAADEPREQREAYMEEQVNGSLQAVPPAQRARYLGELAALFPTGVVMVETPAAAPAATPAAAPAPEKPATPEAVLRLVETAWANFDHDQRALLRERLVKAGVTDPGGGPGEMGDPAVFGEVRQRVGVAPAESIQPARLGRLFLQQLEFLCKLDQLAWTTWRTLAPKSPVKRDNSQGDLRLQTRRYVKGDAEPSDLQIAQQIEVTRQLVAILLGSISQISRGYIKRYQTRYSPEAIMDLVKMEGGGGWTGLDTKCWRKYTEIASEINEATVQNDMQEVVVKYVEDFMRRTVRSGA